MPRRLIGNTAGMVFHVMNRGVRKQTLFSSTLDYEAFVRTMREAHAVAPVPILTFSVMPNHFHMVLWPQREGDLTRFVGRLTHVHACRWQRTHHTRGTGPVYQGRFKAIPVETGTYLFRVNRYVDRNAVRARLVPRAEEWPWCSASSLLGSDAPPLHAWPLPKPSNWLDIINEPETLDDLQGIRAALAHERPFGSDGWINDTAIRLGWIRGLRPVGRPRRTTPKSIRD